MTTSERCFQCGAGTAQGYTGEFAGRPVVFCCKGCHDTAVSIEARGLGEFYKRRKAPQASSSSPGHDTDWQGFDRPEFQQQFVFNSGADERSAELLIRGVHCSACTWLIEKVLGETNGVVQMSVNPLTTRATLRWQPTVVPLSRLMADIAELGYTPTPYARDQVGRSAVKERQQALRRLLVAGLGMMQVMNFAIALYAGAMHDMEPDIREFLRLVSMTVATPVVMYSGAPFFAGAWRSLKNRRPGMDVPVAIAIASAWSLSVFNTVSGHGEVYFDSATMFVFFLTASRFLEMGGRHRAMELADSLSQELPSTATRIESNRPVEVGISELRRSDTILVRPGQTLPADGVLLDENASINEALLSGESAPVPKRRGDTVLAGSINLGNNLHFSVNAVQKDTLLASIGRLITRAAMEKPYLVQVTDKVASWFVTFVLTTAAATAIYWYIVEPDRAFAATLAVLVVTCPCALALATPAAITVAMGSLARRGFLLRRPEALQTLGKITHVVLDKTGTLTDTSARIGVASLSDRVTIQRSLCIASAMEAWSEHPLARAFRPAPTDVTISEFIAAPSRGLEASVDGQRYRVGQQDYVAELAGISNLSAGGIFLGDESGLLARFSLEERLRDGTIAAVQNMRAQGLEVIIASGDQQTNVAQVAARLNIKDWHSSMLPADKLDLVRRLQAGGAIVAAVGDGINDSPVLAGADISIAMGCGTSLAQHSSDCVLTNQSLKEIPTAIKTSNRTRQIIGQNLVWAVIYNVTALPLAASGWLAPWMAALGMSISSLLVVLNAMRLGRSKTDVASSTAKAAQQCCSRSAEAIS